ncbi:phage-associated protein [Escherichia coli]|uniref:Phage-associated protein n=1 Tax=Escherichia coli TaxID=562 RepID=A0A377AP95_ECOLX|nr:phage-associated protein [Escherichia coli]
MKLASRFGRVNQIRRDRPLTHDELMQYVPSVFGEISTNHAANAIPIFPPLPAR